MKDETVSFKTLNAGEKRTKAGELIYSLHNEEIEFSRADVMFWSVSEAKAPSSIVIPQIQVPSNIR